MAAPAWLRDAAAAFPISPIAKSAETIFAPGNSGWPMSHAQLIVTVAWIAGAALITALAFRWQPGAALLRRRSWGNRRRPRS